MKFSLEIVSEMENTQLLLIINIWYGKDPCKTCPIPPLTLSLFRSQIDRQVRPGRLIHKSHECDTKSGRLVLAAWHRSIQPIKQPRHCTCCEHNCARDCSCALSRLSMHCASCKVSCNLRQRLVRRNWTDIMRSNQTTTSSSRSSCSNQYLRANEAGFALLN